MYPRPHTIWLPFKLTGTLDDRKYKGSKIECDMDECSQPIPAVDKAARRAPPVQPVKPSNAGIKNRFATLRLDDSDNEVDDNIDSTPDFPASSIVESSL